MRNALDHLSAVMCRRLAVPALAAAMLLAPPPAHRADAQSSQAIVAVVGGDMISSRDLEDRVRLVLAASGLEITPPNQRRLRPRVLQTLIDEHLQLTESARLGVTVSDAEIARAKRNIETRNRMPDGAYDRFLAANGIGLATANAQLRASLAWTKLVRGRFSTVAGVTADEIDEGLAAFERNLGKPQHRVAEILLPVNDPQRDTEIRSVAERLVAEIRNGSDFAAVAREFSASASAVAGGRIGWVAPGQLAPELDAAIGALQPTQVSDPVRTRSGYHIILLEDRQILMASDPMQARVHLKHILVPLDPQPSEAALKVADAVARSVVSKATGCDDMEDLARQVNSPAAVDLGTVTLQDLSPAMRDSIGDLATGVASDPIRTPDGLSVVMVCSRTEAPSNIPTRRDIEQQLRSQKLESLSQRYLRDLRRAAFVDTRL